MYAHAIITRRHASLKTNVFEMVDSQLLNEIHSALVSLICIQERDMRANFVVSVYVNGRDTENGWKVEDTLNLAGGTTSEECLEKLGQLESLRCTQSTQDETEA